MKLRLIGAVLALGGLCSSANGADLRILGYGSQPSRPIARIVDQGLGYSVVHQPVGVTSRLYRVHVTCTIDESFRQTYCPTPAYYSSCPRAQIACQ